MDKPIQRLAKRLNLTDPEPEPYILTTEEENALVENEIKSAKEHFSWRLSQANFSEMEILKRISEQNWDEKIDRKKIFQNANSAKHQNIWHQEQRVKEKEAEEKQKKELVERCDAKYMFRLMKWASLNNYGRQLVVNDWNKQLITALCYFLSGDERFERELGYSLNKGLLIRGVSGVGKTHLVQCLQENELNPILILSMLEITDEVQQNGEYEIRMGDKKIIYLDDVGTEQPVVMHYGTKISYFKTFIELVYLKNQNKIFNKLIISTNNSFSEFEEKYGFRVRSRIKDMFNVIDVKGQDLRG